MKITNNEIVVELPDTKLDMGMSSDIFYFHMCEKIKGMNKPYAVSVATLEQLINNEIGIMVGTLRCRSIAQHLAANLDKWLIEKKEPV